MAAQTFTLGQSQYEAAERMTYNGVDGILWIKRVKCTDGSGWAHDHKAHMPLRATRKQVVERFGQVYRADQVNV